MKKVAHELSYGAPESRWSEGGAKTGDARYSQGNIRKVRKCVIGIDRKPRSDDADSALFTNRASTGTLHSAVGIGVPVVSAFLIPRPFYAPHQLGYEYDHAPPQWGERERAASRDQDHRGQEAEHDE